MNDLQVRPDRDTAPATPAVKVRKKSLFREYSEAIIIAVLLALFIRQFAVQAFTIPSGSMMDTLLIGDYILVNKFLYGAEIPLTDRHLPAVRDPHRGDIVVFKYPNDETRDFIKRIIAVGGDTVQVRDNRVTLNGRLIDEPYVRPGCFSGPGRSPRRGAPARDARGRGPAGPRPPPGAAAPPRASRCGCRRGRTSSWATTGTTRRTAATGASSAGRRSAARTSRSPRPSS